MPKAKVVIACGGTGGHIYPGLSIGQELQQRGVELVFAGSTLRMEKDKIPEAGYPFMGIPVRQLNKRKPVQSLANWTQCTRKAIHYLKAQRPDALVGLGSYITVPWILAATYLKIPVFLVDTNIVPGKANLYLGKLAQWVAIAHPETARHFKHTHLTGSPVRSDIGQYSREEGANIIGLKADYTTLLITGGSQGARVLNEAVVKDLDALLAIEKLQIVHVCGASNSDEIRARSPLSASHEDYRLLEYVENMPALLAATDIAVSRAGASTIAELLACQIPALLVPGQFGGGHQKDNARAVAEAGAGVMLEEPQLQSTPLSKHIQKLIENKEKFVTMQAKCRELNTGNAAETIAELLLSSLDLTPHTQEASPC